MKILQSQPGNGALHVVCNRCYGPLDAASTVVGAHGGELRLLHQKCANQEFQFFEVSQARTMTLPGVFNELLASVGLSADDL